MNEPASPMSRIGPLQKLRPANDHNGSIAVCAICAIWPLSAAPATVGAGPDSVALPDADGRIDLLIGSRVSLRG